MMIIIVSLTLSMCIAYAVYRLWLYYTEPLIPYHLLQGFSPEEERIVDQTIGRSRYEAESIMQQRLPTLSYEFVFELGTESGDTNIIFILSADGTYIQDYTYNYGPDLTNADIK